ncbi:kinase-like domain-containing protein [Gongronella butleri]|nr:kinase-like domain-containing protein [Gongronella butleri]
MSVLDYDLLEQIGVGAFGTVYRARHKVDHTLVAIKVMKHKNQDTCQQEYATMRQLQPHANIVRLYDAFTDTHALYFVLELLNGGNFRQILQGLASLHDQGFAHRDLKPENLLLDTHHRIIKLADFGLAKRIDKAPCTDYVSTRWYRAPEILLKAPHYTTAVDVWSFGTLAAEIVTLFPLFPGESELDQLNRMCHILGSPSSTTRTRREGGAWKEGIKMANKLGFRFPQTRAQGLASVFEKDVSPLLIDLMRRCLFFDPSKRLAARDALLHPYFFDDNQLELELEQQQQQQQPRSASMPPQPLAPHVKKALPPVPKAQHAAPSSLLARSAAAIRGQGLSTSSSNAPQQRHSSPFLTPGPTPRPSVSHQPAKKPSIGHLFRKKSALPRTDTLSTLTKKAFQLPSFKRKPEASASTCTTSTSPMPAPIPSISLVPPPASTPARSSSLLKSPSLIDTSLPPTPMPETQPHAIYTASMPHVDTSTPWLTPRTRVTSKTTATRPKSSLFF